MGPLDNKPFAAEHAPMVNFGDPRLPERFWGKCIPEPNSGCWLWFGSIKDTGYGQIMWKFPGQPKRPKRAHRLSYEILVGAVPLGLELDHLCRTRICVNPAHLEAVTKAENIRRGDWRKSVEPYYAAMRARTHCKHGHEWTELNTARYPNGSRRCRTCGAKRVAEQRQRLRSG